MHFKKLISIILILCTTLPSFSVIADDGYLRMIYRTDFSEFTENYPSGIDITDYPAGNISAISADYPKVDTKNWQFLFWWQFVKGGTGGFYKDSSTGESYMHMNGYKANGDYIRFAPLDKNPADVEDKLVISEKISYHTSANIMEYSNYWPAGTLMSYATGTSGVGGALIMVRRYDNMLFTWKTSGQSQIAKDKSNIIELGYKISSTPVELSAVIDFKNNSYDIYVNGTCKASGVKSINFTDAPFRNFDLYSSGSVNAKLYGFAIYESDGYKKPEVFGGYKYHKYDGETREFAVYNAEYSCNGEGAELNCEIYNNKNSPTDISVLTAIYKDNLLVDVLVNDISLDSYEIYPFEDYVELPFEERNQIRYYFVENLSNIRPLDNDVTFYASDQKLEVLKYVDFRNVDLNNPLDYTLKFRIYNKDNDFKVVEKDGRNWWHLSHTLSNDPHIDINIDMATPDKLYQEIEFMWQSLKNDIRIIGVHDEYGSVNSLVSLKADGGLYLPNGEKIALTEKNQSVLLVCETDFANKCYSVYKDGIKIASNISLEETVSDYLDKWRIYMHRGAEAQWDIGKIALYTANCVIDWDEEFGEEISSNKYRYFSDEYAVNQAKSGSVAFSTYGSYVLTDGERVKIENKPVISEDKYFIPFEILKKAYNASENGELITVNGAEISGKRINGVLYAEISEASNALNLDYFADVEGNEQGFGIMGNHSFNDFRENSYNYREINNYLIFERPKAEEISSKFQSNLHHRIYAGKDTLNNLFQQAETVEWKKNFLESLLTEADSYVSSNDISVDCSDGVRLDAASFMEQRIKVLSIAHLYSKNNENYNDEYLKRAVHDIETIGERSDWNPSHFLDTAAVTYAFAIAYDWLYDDLSEENKKYIADKIVTKGLKYAEASYMGNWEIDVDWGAPIGEDDIPIGNWALVCQTGIISGAVAIMDIPEYQALASKVIEAGLRHIEYSLTGFAPEGAWDEGAAYWEFACKYFTGLMETLKLSFGTTFGYLDYEPLEKSSDFMVAMSCATSGFAFGDGEIGMVNSLAMPYFAYAFDNKDYKNYLLGKIEANLKPVNLNDALFLDGSYNALHSYNISEDMYFKAIETGVMSSGLTDNESTCVGYHCGTNMAGHMNYDSGTFVFDSMGVRWIEDTGKDNYNIPGYGGKTPDNEELAYASRTEGNNCFVLNPSYHSGQEKETYGQKIIRKEESDSEAYVVMDISASYTKDATSALRGFKLTDDRNSLIIRDEINLKAPTEFYSFMHTTKNVETDSENPSVAYFTDVSGKKLKAELVSNKDVSFKVMEAKRLESSPPEHELQKYFGNYKKLAVYGNVNGKLNVTIKLTPVIDGIAFSDISDIPLSEWTVNPQSMVKRENLFLEDIKIGGISYGKFNKYITSYGYLAGALDAYMVQGIPTGENMEAKTFENGSLFNVVVKQKNRPTNFKVYTLNIREIPISKEDGIPSGTQLINPEKISVSNQINGSAVFDGTFETFWTGSGEGVYIIYEFDRIYDISAIDVGVFQSYRRRQYVDLYVSLDGITYFPVVTGARTTAPGKGYQRFSFDCTDAKYVKLVCNNYEDAINNYNIVKSNDITEFYVYGK